LAELVFAAVIHRGRIVAMWLPYCGHVLASPYCGRVMATP